MSALDVKDGKKTWSTRIGKAGNPNKQPRFPAARSTPAVDGAVLYALGSDGDLVCLDAATGKVRWQKSLRNDFGGLAPTWTYAESPLADGDVALIEASPEAYREQGRFTRPNQPAPGSGMEKSWAYPAISDGRLYVRDLETMWCYDVRAPKEKNLISSS